MCLLKYGFTWTSGAGRADFGGNHFIITHSDKNGSARQASTGQALCAQVQSLLRVHPAVTAAHLGPLGFANTIPFWDSLLLELSAQCCYLRSDRRKLNPPGNFLHLRTSFAASAPSGEVDCNVQVLIYIFVPLKEHKWLNKPGTDQGGWTLPGSWRSWHQLGALQLEPADINDTDANLMSNVLRGDYSFWTEMSKELQSSTCDGTVLPHR